MFWETEKDEKENEKISARLTAFTNNLSDKRVLHQSLLIYLSGNIIIWLCVLLMPQTINRVFDSIFELSNKLGVMILGIPFGLALFSTYALCRLKLPNIEDNKQLKTDLMSSFDYQSDSTKRLFVWLFSITVEVINVLLIVLVDLYFNDQL